MTNFLKGAVVATLPILLLAGCASHSKRDFTVGSVQHTYKTKHPIVIDEGEKTLDIPVASQSSGLPRAVASSIEGYGGEFLQAANGTITIMVPSGSSNESGARAILPSVTNALTVSGVPAHRMNVTSYYAAEHGATAPIRLSYIAVTAKVEQCGKWPEDLAAQNNNNQNYHNFGCASQNNLAAIIANPADLLAPRGTTPIDAARRNQVIESYRNAENTATEL